MVRSVSARRMEVSSVQNFSPEEWPKMGKTGVFVLSRGRNNDTKMGI
jgi:hypothetical protein